jgi:hypothetical protein
MINDVHLFITTSFKIRNPPVLIDGTKRFTTKSQCSLVTCRSWVIYNCVYCTYMYMTHVCSLPVLFISMIMSPCFEMPSYNIFFIDNNDRY